MKHAFAWSLENPEDWTTLLDRVANRPGKNIPLSVLHTMKTQLEMPSYTEGFDTIRILNIRDKL